ncbi:aspartyl protease [Ceratobasidium sp. AG-Ba]|nr:aspartyl protease [Ceratobasidium sp. AG-Ba]
MSGDGFVEAIYSIPLNVGSGGSSFWMQVDSGSSDLWLASTSCQSTVCQRAGTDLYGWSTSTVDSGNIVELSYLSGYVQGNVVWDTLQLGGYSVTNQALISGVQINNEHLSSHFVGLIGLALEHNSVIRDKTDPEDLQFPVRTFVTDLLTSSTAPSSRTIGVSLERPGQSNSGTPSLLSIGRHPSSVVPDPSKIAYTPLEGDTHWRVQVTQIVAWVPGDWSNNSPTSRGLERRGTYGPGVPHSLTLGKSLVSSSIWPLAIPDTGGAHIVTSRDLANAFWGTYQISPASDGMYYVPCRTPVNVSFEIGGIDYSVHPLDMTYMSAVDSFSGQCIGAWQASDSLRSGDIILGTAFMRNVYTAFQYDTPTNGVFQNIFNPSDSRPLLGLMSLTNWETALQDFYRVRVLGQPLEDPSAVGSGPGSSGGGSSSGVNAGTNTDKDKKLSVGLMALIGILVFFGVAAALFGLRWWMMKRRWRKMRAAAAVMQDAEKETEQGTAIPRPRQLNKDEVYERAHSGAFNRESVVWDDVATVVGSRSSRIKERRKPQKVSSRVGVMGEWVEPESDEEEEPVNAGKKSGSLGSGAESWAAVRPRQMGDLDVLERANRTMSFAGVGAGENVRFVGDSDFERPLSMPGPPPSSSSTAPYHRPTYSREDSGDASTPLLLKRSSVKSPLGQTSFAPEQLAMPSTVDELARARPSVDLGLGGDKDGVATPGLVRSHAGSGYETPINKGSIDITSPGIRRPQ